MSKAILVLDKMPDYCEECPAVQANDAGSPICGASNGGNCEWEWVDNTGCETRCPRADWCPLKEVPQKLAVGANDDDYVTPRERDAAKRIIKNEQHFHNGWNACIDEITEGCYGTVDSTMQ